jgi:hypothetical protein
MTFTYEARRGPGYYFNTRRVHNNLYKADCLHYTSAGWILDEDLKIHLKPAEFETGELKIRGLQDAAQVTAKLIEQMAARFPEAVAND